MGKVSFWYNTAAAYAALSSKSNDSLYVVSSGAIYKGSTLVADKTSVTNKAVTLAWGTSKTVATINGVDITVSLPTNPNSDTKNTAGSTDTSSKIFLIGATSQAANPQTYSHDTCYIGTDGCIYSGGSKVLTSHQSLSGYATQTWVNQKGFYKSGDSPTFGSWLQLEASGGDGIYLDAEDDISSLTGVSRDAGVAGLHIENPVYMEHDLVVEDEIYAGSYNQFSDRRLKNHIANRQLTLDEMMTIPLASFSFKKDESHVRVGTYAQDVREVLPEAVSLRGDMLTLDYQALNTALSLSLVRIVDAQQHRIAELEMKLNAATH